MGGDQLVVRQRAGAMAQGAVWSGLLTLAVVLGIVLLARLSLVIAVLAGVPAVLLFGRVTVTAARLAVRPQRLTVDGSGITVDSQGRTWHFPWQDVLWIGLMIGTRSVRPAQSLVAVLGPGAPPVRTRSPIPPVWLRRRRVVLLFDLMTGDRDPVATTNAVESFAGAKWRDDPVLAA